MLTGREEKLASACFAVSDRIERRIYQPLPPITYRARQNATAARLSQISMPLEKKRPRLRFRSSYDEFVGPVDWLTRKISRGWPEKMFGNLKMLQPTCRAARVCYSPNHSCLESVQARFMRRRGNCTLRVKCSWRVDSWHPWFSSSDGEVCETAHFPRDLYSPAEHSRSDTIGKSPDGLVNFTSFPSWCGSHPRARPNKCTIRWELRKRKLLFGARDERV